MELTTLYDYYKRQNIAPTFADLRDEESVAAYQAARERLLGDRLGLPIPFFRGSEILEFGPDTGENAVVFARWGARMTLVEPAEGAHARVRAYFDRFAPPGALRDLVAADVLTYKSERRFDMIVAEGFIYTVLPSAAWLASFGRALVPGGLALVSYIERRASLFELLLRVPFTAWRRRTGVDRARAAEELYRPKWDRIPHTRTFASWAMDVLDNPFMRLRYFIAAGQLAQDAAAAGFGIGDTWPAYRDGLENGWAKRESTVEQNLARTCAHLRRSVLTFVLGTKAYLVEDQVVSRFEDLIDRALIDVDALIDIDDASRSLRLASTLSELAALGRASQTVSDGPSALVKGFALIDAWADINRLLATGDLDSAVKRLREDPVLLDGWGAPTHLAVLRFQPHRA